MEEQLARWPGVETFVWQLDIETSITGALDQIATAWENNLTDLSSTNLKMNEMAWNLPKYYQKI